MVSVCYWVIRFIHCTRILRGLADNYVRVKCFELDFSLLSLFYVSYRLLDGLRLLNRRYEIRNPFSDHPSDLDLDALMATLNAQVESYMVLPSSIIPKHKLDAKKLD